MRIRSSILAFALALSLLTPTLQAFDGEHAQEVRFIKSLLLAEGKDLSGACGAFQITGRVAFKLKDKGFKLLRKAGGNRAIILPDGSCVDGDHGSGPGYATDYLISVDEGFVGYDLLGDGGGANGPQWIGPENGLDIIARNAQNAVDPFSLGGDVVVPAPTPTPAPAPTPLPVPVPVPTPPSADPSLTTLIERIIALQELTLENNREILILTKDTNVQVSNMNRTITQTLGSISKFVGKYIAPAIAGYITAKQLGK